MKKILVVNIGTEIGGIEKSLLDFLRFLLEEKHQVFLATWKEAGPLDTQIPDGVIRLENLGPGSLNNIFKKSKSFPEKIKRFAAYVKFKIFGLFECAWKSLSPDKEEYDTAISFCQNGYSPYYVIDKVNAKRKLLFYHHGTYEKKGREKAKDESYFSKYTNIISVSTANKIMLQSHFPKLQDKIKVVGNLLNEGLIESLSNETITDMDDFSALKICTVGRLSHEKGQDIALDTAKILKDKGLNFKWFFIGEGPTRSELEQRVDSYGLKDYCFFLGEKANPYPYVKQADLYVQTSRVESYSLTVHEANILGKPTIASDLPAIRELLSHGKYGELCEIEAEAFAYKINQFYDGNKIENNKLVSLNNENKIKLRELL